MTPRGKSALLWGGVGALSFLVFHQGYLLAGGRFLGVGPVAGVAVVVFALTTVLSYSLEGRVEAFEDGAEPSEDDDEERTAGDRPPGEQIQEERLKAKEQLDERLQDGSE